MIARVVVPVDFTDESARALVVAQVLAGRARARVALVSVVESSGRAAAESQLAEAAGSVGASGDGATWRVLESSGPVEAALLSELLRSEHELWCVGSHARGALGELLMGSLSETLVRDAHVPVVLVGPHVTVAPAGRVLAVALDGSEPSEAILPAAADLARALGMSLRMLQVVEPGGEMPGDAIETAYLRQAAGKVPPIDRHAVDFLMLHGEHPADDLATYVTAQPEVGMVATATRGLTGVDRLLHGSTAFDLAHRGTVPVLILHNV